jgi:hypothetical protein
MAGVGAFAFSVAYRNVKRNGEVPAAPAIYPSIKSMQPVRDRISLSRNAAI